MCLAVPAKVIELDGDRAVVEMDTEMMQRIVTSLASTKK